MTLLSNGTTARGTAMSVIKNDYGHNASLTMAISIDMALSRQIGFSLGIHG